MKHRHLIFAPLILPSVRPAEAATESGLWPQHYDAGYQLYQEDDDRIQVEAFYLRGKIEVNSDTSFRFQYLHDAISGSSPTGAQPGGLNPFLSEIEDVREGYLAAIDHQFGDHRVELEVAYSTESDYDSTGFALADDWDFNQKNTKLKSGINYLADRVQVPGIEAQDKTGLDLFTGVSQVIDKNTVVSANLTVGYADGYLNDPYKAIQRDDSAAFGLPPGTLVNMYAENRPDSRFRQVLQLEGTHYVTPANAAIDAVLRLSHDDYGINSETVQLEWRQAVGEKCEIAPFFRYYHQSAADFFVNSLDGVVPAGVTPPDYPNGSGPNYSADYRLSSMDTLSLGVRLHYKFNETFSASASYERYSMSGAGSDSAPEQSYPDADIWTFGIRLDF